MLHMCLDGVRDTVLLAVDVYLIVHSRDDSLEPIHVFTQLYYS